MECLQVKKFVVERARTANRDQAYPPAWGVRGTDAAEAALQQSHFLRFVDGARAAFYVQLPEYVVDVAFDGPK
jgi:hypothetical protein